MIFLHLLFRSPGTFPVASESSTNNLDSACISPSRNTPGTEMYNNNVTVNSEDVKHESASGGTECEMRLPPKQDLKIDEPD